MLAKAWPFVVSVYSPNNEHETKSGLAGSRTLQLHSLSASWHVLSLRQAVPFRTAGGERSLRRRRLPSGRSRRLRRLGLPPHCENRKRPIAILCP